MDKLATSARTSSARRAARPGSATATPPRRKRRTTATRAVPQLTITRLKASIELTPPRGCCATVVLKEVDRDDKHRYYSIWLVVGRSGDDAATMHYKHSGEDMIRCDLPEGTPMSVESIQPALTAFWAQESLKPGDTPIVKGGGSGGTQPG